MIIFFGTYHWKQKGVGFRPDFCLCCKQETVSVQVRSFDVGHLWWIPIVPLGFRRHWRCSVCAENPRGERTGRVLKIIGVIFLLAAGGLGWTMPAAGEDAIIVWVMRLGFPALAAAVVASFRQRRKEDAALLRRLRELPPMGDACPFCGQRVKPGARRSCGACGAVESVPPELATA